ncbi:putative ArsR family transcriptional regulator [Salirhabdus euzebyi]|uniref:Putative ArsR family transcriptional regulator n=1 Tax=Salirhabdus euzebyi TaxID=394506 RepID=A0A841Q7J6_9BACI|nr:helix-turn-helix domain-containing protein [Salirhabdus euzebyi]MBB6454262.1 putative ArsR family transcriptional regulator [Salirhabdus euzebyi]
MDQTLKITNVLNDGTRLSIYEYVSKKHDVVNVQEIADRFAIHPNVARLHLSKLEDIGMIVSTHQKNQKGGRPYRVYKLSDEVIKLQFPYRDYELLAKMAIESLFNLGEVGKEALLVTGKKFGKQLLVSKYPNTPVTDLNVEQKLTILNETSSMLGLDPEYDFIEKNDEVIFKIFNCPFKEIAADDNFHTICEMHRFFIKGMFEELFDNLISLKEHTNMLDGCQTCTYHAIMKP